MNKLVIIIAVSILLLSSGVLAKDVGYIVKFTNNPDPNFISVLNDLGLTYDLISESSISTTNFSKYSMILLGDESIYSAPVNDYNSLFVNPYYYSGWSAFIGSSASNQPLKANNTNTQSIISKNMIGQFQVYTSCCAGNGDSLPMYYMDGPKNSGVTKISSTKTSGGEYVIATKNNPRREFFGITKSSFWTENSTQLFKNSVLWVLRGDDFDGDGYFSNQDCNDSNPNIHPNATEIPYNHIDENCDGKDLADVDGDGYCKLGYAIENKALQCPNETGTIGTDCNDNNPNIYPGAPEAGNGTDTNCIAEAPVFLKNIDNITWQESQTENLPTLNLSDYFYDLDGNYISYFVNSSSPVKQTHTIINGSIVNFYSDKYWNGQDWLVFGAVNSEGLMNFSNTVYLQVLPVNDPPILPNITDFYFSAGDLVSLDLQAFDPDQGETLTYNLTGDIASDFSGNNPWLWQSGLGDSGDYKINVEVTDGVYNDSRDYMIHILPKVVINEVELGNSSGGKWVELYNPGETDVNISGLELWHSMPSSQLIGVLDGVLSSNAYYIIEAENLSYIRDNLTLYNNGNIVDKTPTLYDPYLNENTWQRVPNGVETGNVSDWQFQKATRGMSNDADVLAPNVSLISPLNHENFTVDHVEFNYSVVDDKASELNCSVNLFILNKYEVVDSQIAENGANSSLLIDNISDNIYPWFISCSDGNNTGYSSTRSFILNEPDPPVIDSITNYSIHETENATIIIYAHDPDIGDNLTYYINQLNNSNFTQQNENTFVWQTGYEDAGIYYVEVRVTDNMFNTTALVQVIVKNTNRAPLVQDIAVQRLLEDTNSSVEINATDPDKEDSLNYSIVYQNASEVACSTNATSVLINPAKDWNSQQSLTPAYCTLKVSDGQASNYTNIIIDIIPVNDPPWFGVMNNVTVNETETAIITVYANDVANENENLTAWAVQLNNSNFTQNGDVLSWKTDYNSAGVYYVEIWVSDGELNTSTILQVTVNDVNEPPHWNTLPELQIEEDSGDNLLIANLSDYSYDNDGNITGFEIVDENLSQVDCYIINNSLYANPAKDFATNNFSGLGDRNPALCTIAAVDNKGAMTNIIAKINVSNVNDAPVLDSASPAYPLVRLTEDGNKMFSVSYHDIDSGNLNVSWFRVNMSFSTIIDMINENYSMADIAEAMKGKEGILQEGGNSYNFIGNGSDQDFIILTFIYDSAPPADNSSQAEQIAWLNNDTAIMVWFVQSSSIPLADTYDGSTSNFTGMTDDELKIFNPLVLERTEFNGKITFLEGVDLRDVVDFDTFATIENGLAGIDTSEYPTLRNKARIEFGDLNFNKVPTIYYTSVFTTDPDQINSVCPDSICSNINYNNDTGKLSFDVSSFSTFKVGDTRTCSDQGGSVCGTGEKCTSSFLTARDSDSCCATSCVFDFKDIETCNVSSSNIDLKIESPGKGDDFKAGDTINGTIKVYNRFSDSRDFNVEIAIYDLTDNSEIQTTTEDVSVNDKDNAEQDFSIDIPTDIDSSHKYVLHADAKDADNESLCFDKYQDLKIKKDSYSLRINSVNFLSSYTCGDDITADINLENIGKYKIDDAYIKATSEFDSFQSEIFTMGIGKKLTKEISLSTFNTTNKNYTVNLDVFFKNDKVSQRVPIMINCKEKQVSTSTEEAGNLIQNLSSGSKIESKSNSNIVILLLGITLAIILILIIMVMSRKREEDLIVD